MEKLARYRTTIDNILTGYADWSTSDGVTAEKVIDLTKDHFEVVRFGWEGNRHIHGSILHLDIRNEKIWIQYDGTSNPVALELEAAGVPKCDIVLGFIPPEHRPYTGYAVG